MKYVVSETEFAYPENGCRQYWLTEDHNIFWTEIDNQNITTYYDYKNLYAITINCIIHLNKDNPQSSIDKIKRLAILK